MKPLAIVVVGLGVLGACGVEEPEEVTRELTVNPCTNVALRLYSESNFGGKQLCLHVSSSVDGHIDLDDHCLQIEPITGNCLATWRARVRSFKTGQYEGNWMESHDFPYCPVTYDTNQQVAELQNTFPTYCVVYADQLTIRRPRQSSPPVAVQ
jgi:hypothetical protein